MSYIDRKELYKKLEEKRKRPLLVYVTSIRPGCSAQMAQDVLPEFIKQINTIDKAVKEIDLLVLSNGGDPIVSWRIITLLREKFDKVSILIPYTAYSAATLLALGGDEIIMHPYGNLGPIDPQINITTPQGQTTIGYEDIIKYIEFVKGIGITDQELIQKSFEKLTSEIAPTTIGFAKRSSQLGLTMGEKLLATHMTDENKTKVISETLNSKFYHHGYPLGRKEAKEIGLPIAKSDPEIEDIIWDICEDIMEELEFNKTFDPEGLIKDKIAKQPLPQIGKVNTVKEEIKLAFLESIKLNCFIKNEFIANYIMQPDTSMNMNVMARNGSWEREKGDE